MPKVCTETDAITNKKLTCSGSFATTSSKTTTSGTLFFLGEGFFFHQYSSRPAEQPLVRDILSKVSSLPGPHFAFGLSWPPLLLQKGCWCTAAFVCIMSGAMDVAAGVPASRIRSNMRANYAAVKKNKKSCYCGWCTSFPQFHSTTRVRRTCRALSRQRGNR